MARALELGATLFDTAPNYGSGTSERLLGEGRPSMAVGALGYTLAYDEVSCVIPGLRTWSSWREPSPP